MTYRKTILTIILIGLLNANCISQVKDTLSFKYFLEQTKNYNRLPDYLVDMFVSSDLKFEEDPFRVFYGEEKNYFRLHDFYVVTIGVSSFGVCSETYLATYNISGKPIGNLNVMMHCDRDLSSPTFDYLDYNIYADSIVELIYTTEEPIDKSLLTKDTILDFSEIPSEEKQKYSYYVITKYGLFNNIQDNNNYIPGDCHFEASIRVLNEDSLRKLSKSQLRLLRNEIFARKGYTFNSQDLQDYFNSFEWYEPISKDVVDKLTPIELYNINLIKSIENK